MTRSPAECLKAGPRRATDRSGQTGQALIEYSLIFALIIIIVLVVLIVMGNTVRNMYCNIAGSLNV